MSVDYKTYDETVSPQCQHSWDDAAFRETPLLDPAVLEELIGEVGLVMFLDFVGRMTSAALDHHARLARAIATGDRDAEQRAAHALCGLLGHFGLMRAARLSHAIETATAGPGASAALEAVLLKSLEALPHSARRVA